MHHLIIGILVIIPKLFFWFIIPMTIFFIYIILNYFHDFQSFAVNFLSIIHIFISINLLYYDDLISKYILFILYILFIT